MTYMMLAMVLIMTVVHRVESGHPEGSWTEDNTLRGILSDGSLLINVATGRSRIPQRHGCLHCEICMFKCPCAEGRLNSVVGLTLDGADLSLSAFETGLLCITLQISATLIFSAVNHGEIQRWPRLVFAGESDSSVFVAW